MSSTLRNVLLFACLAHGCAGRTFAELQADGKAIVSVFSEELPADEKDALALDLGLRVGATLNEADLSQALRNQGQDGRWMRVFVYAEPEGKGIRLQLRGTRVRKLRKLEFPDVDPEVLAEVKNRIRQDQDQTADVESFSTLRQALKEAYQDRGYYYAQVQFVTRNLSPSEADVDVRVVPNQPTRVSRVQIRGAPEDEIAAMTELIPLHPGDIFNKQKVTDGVERINSYLRANQYPSSRVADTVYTFSKDSFEAEVSLILKMGERFQIRFTGYTVFDEVQLRTLLTDEVLAQADPSERIAALVEAKYRAVGYPDATVQIHKALVDEGRLNLIELRIQEGRRVRISDLRFASGDRAGGVDLEQLFFEVAPGVLQRGLYWAEGVSEAVDKMQERLRAKGYLNARIAEPKPTFSEDRQSVVLFFDSDLGVQTLVSKITFSGADSLARSDIEKQLTVEVGSPLNRDAVVESGVRVLQLYSNSGFPQAKFARPPESTIELSRDQTSATVLFEIVEGTKFSIGTIQIEGLRKTKSKTVMRDLGLETGDTYDASRVRQAEENISLLGLFSRVEIIETPSPARPGEMDLRVLVRETRPGVGEVGLGGVYEEPRLRVRSFVGLAYRNVSGLNQTASVRGQIALPFSRVGTDLSIPFVEYETLLGYRYPWALNLPITFNSQLGVDRIEVRPAEQTILTRVRVEGRLEKKFNPRITGIYRLIRVERTTTQSLKPVDPADGVALTESIGSTGPGIVVDLRDDIFNPTRGSFHAFDLELALPALFSQSNIAFVLGLMRNSFYVPLHSSVGLAFSLNLGYAHSLLGDQPIARARLVSELSLGGQGSIRGIAPRRLSPDLASRRMAFYNGRVELSTRLFEDFGVAVFFDTGQIYPDMRPLPRSDGVGVGLRYKTPVGPVVIDFAKGIGNLGEAVKFYFTVGTI